jgi:hypothetical protein
MTLPAAASTKQLHRLEEDGQEFMKGGDRGHHVRVSTPATTRHCPLLDASCTGQCIDVLDDHLINSCASYQ